MDLTNNAQLLTLILNESQCQKCVRLAKENGILGGMVTIGRGTVNNAILNLLGIKNQKKEIINFLLSKEQAEDMLDRLDEDLQLKKPGKGIAFTTSVLGSLGLPNQVRKDIEVGETTKAMEGKSMFKKMTMIVDRGMSDEVMGIAREAGVRGGTILHGRGAGTEIATNLFGIEIEPEKELVIILTPNDLVDKVMNALSEGLNLNEPGKGILFVEPLLDTRGLVEMSDEKEVE
ncbi:MAG TPA: P-II family nitrogen regulator [Bacillota bacterium]|nr:P-II family nitrogen regulator [Bacillota bacterium]